MAENDRVVDGETQLQHRQRLMELKKENMALLETNLFPVLDGLHAAGAEEVHALEEFADQLMDWSTNLDSGLYVKIHDAFLSLARVRKDRDGIIRELYKLGMGLYYLNRMLEGLEIPGETEETEEPEEPEEPEESPEGEDGDEEPGEAAG